MGLLELGQLVTSKRGRDSGKRYVVVEFCDDRHVMVADGLVRKLSRPKRKNMKHLIVHSARLEAGSLDDRAIRQFIEQHSGEEELGKEVSQDYGQR